MPPRTARSASASAAAAPQAASSNTVVVGSIPGLKEALRHACKTDEAELELNFNGYAPDDRAFKRVINALHASAVFEGVTQAVTLDISMEQDDTKDRKRLTIEGKDAVDVYCRNPYPSEALQRKGLIKREVRREASADFHVQMHLREEREVQGEELNALETLLTNSDKRYRLKQRSSFTSAKYGFRVDASVVRQGSGALGAVMQAPPRYELELELVDKKRAPDALIRELDKLCVFIVRNLLNSQVLVTVPEQSAVVLAYLAITADQAVSPARIARAPAMYFVGPKPVTLSRDHLQDNDDEGVSVLRAYNVTDKADGERALLFVDGAGACWMINNRMEVRATGVKVPNHANTLMDGEYVDQWKTGMEGADIVCTSRAAFMAFDVYWAGGKAVAQLPFKAADSTACRHGIMTSACTELEQASKDAFVRITAKRFYFVKEGGGTIFEAARECLQAQRMYETDGIILTPDALPVGANYPSERPVMRGTWRRVLKWKPPHLNTVDFLVRIGGASAGTGEVIAALHVGAPLNSLNVLNVLAGRSATANAKYEERQFASATLKADPAPRCEDGEPIQSGTVVEFAYDVENAAWKPLRVRHDKTALYRRTGSIAGAANDISVANNVMASILEPVEEDMMTGSKPVPSTSVDAYYNRDTQRNLLASLPMLDFHNAWVKGACMIGKLRLMGAKKVMDLACGKGGDMGKLLRAGAQVIVGVDVSADNLANPDDGAYVRLADARARHKDAQVAFVQADCSKPLTPEHSIATGVLREVTDAVLGFVPATKIAKALAPYHGLGTGTFDAVSLQFALHYFFKDEAALDGLCATVRARLRKGGVFMATFMDGDEVVKLLTRAGMPVLRGKKEGKIIWSIAKQYDAYSFDNPGANYGKQIDVFVESINQTLPEYLVDFQLLTRVLGRHDIVPIDDATRKRLKLRSHTGLFSELYKDLAGEEATAPPRAAAALKDMSAEEKRFSFLNRWCMFMRA